MRRIRLVIEYDGTNYVGWQTQSNGIAVQQVIEQELKKMTGEQIALHASGRTDSGVHALGQVAHFDTNVRMGADKFAYALNTKLPGDIRIRLSEETTSDFHARFTAKRKWYRYTVYQGDHARVFLRNTALHIHGKLDIASMQKAAQAVIGVHDFAAFKAANTKIEHTVREIYRSSWRQEGRLLYYDVEGNGFLYNMVRILVGTMLDIGRGRIAPDSIERALQTGARENAGATAPAHGLTLMGVCYADLDTRKIE